MTLAKLRPTCATCGIIFETAYPKQKYCCVVCAFRSNLGPIPDEGCWEWQGSTAAFGYGEFRYNDKLIRAHRYSYELHYGPIDGDLSILHGCDNPRCCRPTHLSAGTQADNMNDVAVRYRGLKSITIPTAKEIEAKLLAGQRMSILAREYGVSHPTIQAVRNRMRRAGVKV